MGRTRAGGWVLARKTGSDEGVVDRMGPRPTAGILTGGGAHADTEEERGLQGGGHGAHPGPSPGPRATPALPTPRLGLPAPELGGHTSCGFQSPRLWSSLTTVLEPAQ